MANQPGALSPEDRARRDLIQQYFAMNNRSWAVGTIYGSTWRRFVLGRQSSNQWLVARMPGLDRVVRTIHLIERDEPQRPGSPDDHGIVETERG